MCNFRADPYLNTDAGTMSPFEHGEVFVLDDGGEVWTLRSLLCLRAVCNINVHHYVPQSC